MVLSWSKSSVLRSRNSFDSICKTSDRLKNLESGKAFFAYVIYTGGALLLKHDPLDKKEEEFISWFCENFSEIDSDLSSVKEWCILRDLLSGENVLSFNEIIERYSLTYTVFSLGNYAGAVSSFFFKRNDNFVYCKPNLVATKDYAYVSPLFLGVSAQTVCLLDSKGLYTIERIVYDFIKSGIPEMEDFLFEMGMRETMEKLAIIDYIERGVYDPEYYSTVVSIEASRLFYIIGKYLKLYNDIKIEEDPKHDNSYILYSPKHTESKRVLLLSKEANAHLKEYMAKLSMGEDPLSNLLLII